MAKRSRSEETSPAKSGSPHAGIILVISSCCQPHTLGLFFPPPWMSCATHFCFALFLCRDSCTLLNLRSPVVLAGKLGPFRLAMIELRPQVRKEIKHTQISWSFIHNNIMAPFYSYLWQPGIYIESCSIMANCASGRTLIIIKTP